MPRPNEQGRFNERDRMFERYYQDELGYLRELGGEFAHAYPDIARELGLGGHDPDVERLLQGVAFLTGRIRQSVDAQFPELLYPLLGHIWPQALRPVPCTTIVEFLPRPNMFREPEVLKAGAMVRSVPVDGTACQFRTAFDTPIVPLTVESVQLTAPTARQHRLTIALKPLPGAALSRIARHPLRLHFHGATVKGMGREAYGLYASLGHFRRGTRLRMLGPGGVVLGTVALPSDALQPVGFKPSESLLPYPRYSFAGYRHLTEYFLFPSKYLFYDLHGLSVLADFPTAERLELELDLEPLPGEPLSAAVEHIRLNCVPVVNLFAHTASPVSIDGTRTQYPLRPEGTAPDHLDIFSVERVTGHVQRSTRPVEYHPFFSFYRPSASVDEQPVLYQVILRPPVTSHREGSDEQTVYRAVPVYLSFVEPGGEASALEATVSVDLLCTNRDLPLRLRPGDICKPTSDIPSTLQLRDLGAMAAPTRANAGGDGLWRFFAHGLVGLNHFRDRDALRVLLQLFNTRAGLNLVARQKEESLLGAISAVTAEPDTQMVGRPPAVLRGTRVRISVHEGRFAHFGELILFASALDQFLAEAAEVNTFTQLIIHGLDHGQELQFPTRSGTQALL